MKQEPLHSCPELIDYINETGFLPLLSMGIAGWSAEEVTDEDCQYTRLPDGGWEWPLWKWKGAILQESGCAYGKFFKDKAAFISRECHKIPVLRKSPVHAVCFANQSDYRHSYRKKENKQHPASSFFPFRYFRKNNLFPKIKKLLPGECFYN